MNFGNNLRLPKLKSLQIDGTKQKPSLTNIRRVYSNASDKLFNHQHMITQVRDKKFLKNKSYSHGVFPVQIKQKYVSKSPSYFKKQQKLIVTIQPTPKQAIKINQFLQERLKNINKQSLLDLAKKGLLNNVRYKQKIMSYKQSHITIPTEPSMPEIQTRYSSFSPAKMGQIRHSFGRIRPPVVIKL